jgi:hypothetical protein
VHTCVWYEGSAEENQQFMLLWACFEKARRKRSTLARMYVPLMMVRSLLIALCLVWLSEHPSLQVTVALGVFLLWCFYSLCFCPYSFYIRVFLHIYELLFCLQLALLSISTLKPEYSRMNSAIALLVLDYLQLVSLASFSLAIFLANFYGLKCLKREENVVENADR